MSGCAQGGESVEGSCEDVDGIAAGVDGDEKTVSAVVVDDGDGDGVESGEARLDRGGAVVAALHERAAAAVAETIDERTVERHMIGDTTVRAVTAAGEAFNDVGGRKFVVDGGVEGALLGGEEFVEGGGLGDGARKTVEHEAPGAAETMSALADEREDGVVVDESAAMHARVGGGGGGVVGEEAETGGAEEFAGGERAGAERGFEQFGLRAFADTGRADEHQSPRVRHGGGRLTARGVGAENPRVAIACWGHDGRLAAGSGAVLPHLVEGCAVLVENGRAAWSRGLSRKSCGERERRLRRGDNPASRSFHGCACPPSTSARTGQEIRWRVKNGVFVPMTQETCFMMNEPRGERLAFESVGGGACRGGERTKCARIQFP